MARFIVNVLAVLLHYALWVPMMVAVFVVAGILGQDEAIEKALLWWWRLRYRDRPEWVQ